jgi:hypothetical protein
MTQNSMGARITYLVCFDFHVFHARRRDLAVTQAHDTLDEDDALRGDFCDPVDHLCGRSTSTCRTIDLNRMGALSHIEESDFALDTTGSHAGAQHDVLVDMRA